MGTVLFWSLRRESDAPAFANYDLTIIASFDVKAFRNVVNSTTGRLNADSNLPALWTFKVNGMPDWSWHVSRSWKAMRVMLTAMWLLGLTVAAAVADKEKYTGMNLQELCAHGGHDRCDTFGLGFFGGLKAAQLGLRACIPEGVTVEQAMLVVQKYMREHPEWLHMDAWWLTARAIFAAFPCDKPN